MKLLDYVKVAVTAAGVCLICFFSFEMQQAMIRKAVRDVAAEKQSACQCGADCQCPEGCCCKGHK